MTVHPRRVGSEGAVRRLWSVVEWRYGRLRTSTDIRVVRIAKWGGEWSPLRSMLLFWWVIRLRLGESVGGSRLDERRVGGRRQSCLRLSI